MYELSVNQRVKHIERGMLLITTTFEGFRGRNRDGERERERERERE